MMVKDNTPPLRLGIWGHGRMGRAIEAIARAAGDEIVWIADRSDAPQLSDAQLRKAEVVVEFTLPEAAPEHIRRCLEAGVAVVSGTTGWQVHLAEMQELARSGEGALLWASNFSIGVHLYLAMLEQAGRLMRRHPAYHTLLRETHHIHKKDAPSGTAITMAETLIQATRGQWRNWESNPAMPAGEDVLPVYSHREGEVPGTHEAVWDSPVDTILLRHTAHNREGFARGAWQAAHWIRGRKGLFSMRDVLGLDALGT